MSNLQETNKGYTHPDTPFSEKLTGTVALINAVTVMQETRSGPDPCGQGEMGRINIELQKFFEALKGIKKYANLYVNGTINKLQNVTSLIRNVSTTIAGVMKSLMNRLRDFLIDQIRKAVDAVLDLIFPTVVKGLRNTIIQQIIDQIFCAFKNVVKSLKNLAADFLFELVGKVVNAPFCAAQQYTNALVNNLAAIIDKAVGPLLDGINDALGGVANVVGDVFQALDYILGFQSMTCMKPNCPEIKAFKASPWGGPTQQQIDDFENFIAPLGGRQSPGAEGIVGGIDGLIQDIEIFGKRIGDSPTTNIGCDTDPFKCGPPTIELFGGGGIGAAAELVIDNFGTVIGSNILSGGRGYERPPFVTINDSCGNSYMNGYSNIDDNPDSPTFGQVTDIIFTTTPTVPPRDGSDETNPTTGPNDDLDNTDRPQSSDDEIDPTLFGSDYIVCLEGFRVLSMGFGYTTDDIFEIDPNIPNLSVSIKLTDVGQVIDVQIAERICGLTSYPEVDINSPTGDGVIIEPILSFIKIEDEIASLDPIIPDDEIASVDPDVSINTDFVIQAEIAKNNFEGLITTLRGKKLITEKQQKEFARGNVIKIVDCIT